MIFRHFRIAGVFFYPGGLVPPERKVMTIESGVEPPRS